MVIDEGPSPEDLNRFASDTAYCPQCGEEIWDQAEFCPACRTHLGGETSSDPPLKREFKRRTLVVVAVIALLAILLWIRLF